MDGNRSYAIDLCKGKSKYIWIIDADDLVIGNLILPKLTAPCYTLTYGKGFSYQRSQIFKNISKYNWRYECSLHEYPTCDFKNFRRIHIEGDYHVESRRLGDRNKDQHQKFLKDVQVLKDSISDEPNNPRYYFYLAQTYFDSQRLEESIQWYKKRIDIGGWVEEVFYSNYRIAEANRLLNRSPIEITKAYMAAHKALPSRAEPLYQLATYNRIKGNHTIAYQYAKKGSLIPFPKEQILFISDEVYNYLIWDELAVSAYNIGNYQESYDICLKILKEKKFPKNYLTQIQQNRDKAFGQILKNNNLQILVIYIGSIKLETDDLILSICKYLKKDYKIYIFGDNILVAEDKSLEIIFNKTDQLEEFIKNNRIHVLIVCKYLNYFLKYKIKGIRNYIWAIDGLYLNSEYNGIPIEKNGKYLIKNIFRKLDGIITLSNYQKNLFCEKYELKPNKIYVLEPGIPSEYINKNIDKIQNRFIYISPLNKNIDKLIDYFQNMAENNNNLGISLQIIISKPNNYFDLKLSNIKFKDLDKLSESEIYDELLKSEYWFHPLDTIGSYEFLVKIAIMAQSAGCLSIYSNQIGLQEIIQDRGIILKKEIYTEAYKKEILDLTTDLITNQDGKSKYIDFIKKYGNSQNIQNKITEWFELFNGTYKPKQDDINISLYKDTTKFEGYIFYKQLDSIGYDIICYSGKNIEELKQLCAANPDCIGFNSLGYLKYYIVPEDKLKKINYFRDTDGLFINIDKFNKQDLEKTKNKKIDQDSESEDEPLYDSEIETENNKNSENKKIENISN